MIKPKIPSMYGSAVVEGMRERWPQLFGQNVPFLNPHYSVRREKALCVSQVQVLSGELSGHPSSYQDGQKGN